VTIAQGTLDEPRSLLEGMRGVDQVYHVAGLTRARAAREFFRVNGEGTRHLVHACLETPRGPRRLVHLSSLAAVGSHADGYGVCRGRLAPSGFPLRVEQVAG
jgi:nucleoside-diphosphate-sugar epimerase